MLRNKLEPLSHVTDKGATHCLREHLLGTAERASDFADRFGFRRWGCLAGLWHDLGKYSPAFQKKIRSALDREAHIEAKAQVDHSTAGGLYAVEKLGLAGRVLAYVAAGHHAGLPDWMSDVTGRTHKGLARNFRRSLNSALLVAEGHTPRGPRLKRLNPEP